MNDNYDFKILFNLPAIEIAKIWHTLDFEGCDMRTIVYNGERFIFDRDDKMTLESIMAEAYLDLFRTNRLSHKNETIIRV